METGKTTSQTVAYQNSPTAQFGNQTVEMAPSHSRNINAGQAPIFRTTLAERQFASPLITTEQESLHWNEDLRAGEVLDLGPFNTLFEVKLNKISGLLILPPSIQSFECSDIARKSGFKNLEDCKQLTNVKIQCLNGHLKLPSGVVSLKCKSIGQTGILDLTDCTSLTTVKITGDIAGTVLLPSTIVSFECENILKCAKIDLTSCSSLKEVKVGNIFSDLILSFNVRRFQCKRINSEAILDARSCTYLTTVIAEELEGLFIFPNSVSIFKCEKLNNTSVDLSQCLGLMLIKINTFSQTGKLILPEERRPALTKFLPEGINIQWVKKGEHSTSSLPSFSNLSNYHSTEDIASNAVFDLSSYSNFKDIELPHILGETILPPNVERFSCKSIGPNVFLDLSKHLNLKIVEVSDIYGTLILPPNVTTLKCSHIHFQGRLNLEQCLFLQNSALEIGVIDGMLIPPPNITSFKCSNIGPHGKLSSTGTSLQSCSHLKTVQMGSIYSSVMLSNNIEYFSCEDIGFLTVLHLCGCEKLLHVKVNNVMGSLHVPRQLAKLEFNSIPEGVYLILDNCTALKEINFNVVNLIGTLLLPKNQQNSLKLPLAAASHIQWH